LLETSDAVEFLDTTTGALRWKLESEWQTSQEAPAIVNDAAYTVKVVGHLLYNSRSLRAFDLVSGAERWSFPLGNNYSRVGVDRAEPGGAALVLFGSAFGLVAIDLQTRARRWHADCEGRGAVADSIAVCNSKPDQVAAWSVASGNRLWQSDLPEAMWTSPVAVATTVLVRSYEQLYGLDLTTGQLRYTMNLR
jgi:outer membrane protein assembly factor BamB